MGAYNACDIEVLALLTPRYDVECFGMLTMPSPGHADILVVTGPVTRQCVSIKVQTDYQQMPSPKFVVAVGGCACSGAPFKECYNVIGGIDKVIPVNCYVPGCPPRLKQ